MCICILWKSRQKEVIEGIPIVRFDAETYVANFSDQHNKETLNDYFSYFRQRR